MQLKMEDEMFVLNLFPTICHPNIKSETMTEKGGWYEKNISGNSYAASAIDG
jgi:hypothetical protein